MRLPCEVSIREFLPFIRAKIAKILIEEYKWRQHDVADALWISQATVSKYKKILKQKTRIPESVISRIATYWGHKIATKQYNPLEFIGNICHTCYKMRIEGEICRIHKALYPYLEDQNCNVCATEFLNRYEETGERIEVLNDLRDALNLMTSSSKIVKYIPEVRTNIVRAIDNPQDISDIAAFPGRITVHKNEILALSRPEFGASTHMASILMAVNQKDPKLRAITCIKYTPEIDRVIKNSYKNALKIRRHMQESDIDIINRDIKKLDRAPEVIIDLGGVGIEPVVYIFGSTAKEAVSKAIRIIESVPKD
ncbi:MAG: thiamine-phosphate synthase family protein [Candidatus Asgardarchaeia archaeon]